MEIARVESIGYQSVFWK